MNKPRIALTMGDPSGVGPEICLEAVQDPRVLASCDPVIFGDADVLEQVAVSCNLPMPPVDSINDLQACKGKTIKPGSIQKHCGKAAYSYIEEAVAETLAGNTNAIATAPIHKEALSLAGIKEPGHTEILARLTGAEHVCMMLASDTITVALATIHMSIADVPAQLTTHNITRAIELTTEAFQSLGIEKPKLTVCGLNPHAGENGIFGKEEQTIIIPAIKAAESLSADITGPLPPDTAFTAMNLKNTDAYIVMYHDQGLIPFKMLSFETGVNITLGLPIVRTSADHGTAFDIAWQGKASPESMIQSIIWAARLAAAREA